VILIGSARAVHITHTCAPEDAPPFGRAPPPSRKQVLRRARVTWHPMMQLCGNDRPGLAEPVSWHGVGPSRRGTYAIERYSESTLERADAWHGTVDCTLDPPEGVSGPGVSLSRAEGEDRLGRRGHQGARTAWRRQLARTRPGDDRERARKDRTS
jgi:hypothetical protein